MSRTLVARERRIHHDTFSRTVGTAEASFGYPDRGPGVRKAVGSGGSYDDLYTSGGKAVLRVDNAANGGRGYRMDLSEFTNTPGGQYEIRFKYSLDVLLAGSVSVELEEYSYDGDGNDGYYTGVTIGPDGSVTPYGAAFDESWNWGWYAEQLLAGVTYVAGEEWWLAVSVTGVPALVRVKTWKVGESEPDWQFSELSDFDPRGLTALPKTVQLWVTKVGAGTVTATLDDLEIVAPRRSATVRAKAGFDYDKADAWGAQEGVGDPKPWQLGVGSSGTGILAVADGVGTLTHASAPGYGRNVNIRLDYPEDAHVKYKFKFDKVPEGTGDGIQLYIETYVWNGPDPKNMTQLQGLAAYLSIAIGGAVSLELNDGHDWSQYDFAVLPDAYVADTWWWFESKEVGRALMARAWPDGSATPDWQVSVSSPARLVLGQSRRVSIGSQAKTGITNFPIVESFDDVEIIGPRVSATRVFEDKFTRTVVSGPGVPDRGLGSSDPGADYTDPLNWEVWGWGGASSPTYAVTPGAMTVTYQTGSVGTEVWAYRQADGSGLPQDCRYRIRFSLSSAPTTVNPDWDGYFGAWIKSRWSDSPEVFVFHFYAEGVYLTLSRGGTYAAVTGPVLFPFTVTPGEDIWVSYELKGTSIKAKIWNASDPEPDWMISRTSSAPAIDGSNSFGIGQDVGVDLMDGFVVTFKEITIDGFRRLA